MSEIWKTVVGCPEYEVSNVGQVRRCKGGRGAMLGNIKKPSLDRRTGYWKVPLNSGGAQVTKSLHRMVAEAFLGPAPDGKNYVRHIDGSRTNNAVENLCWASQKENMADTAVHGTRKQGEGCSWSKLTAVDVAAIRSSSERTGVLSKRFNVAPPTICDIRAGRTWGSTDDRPR